MSARRLARSIQTQTRCSSGTASRRSIPARVGMVGPIAIYIRSGCSVTETRTTLNSNAALASVVFGSRVDQTIVLLGLIYIWLSWLRPSIAVIALPLHRGRLLC